MQLLWLCHRLCTYQHFQTSMIMSDRSTSSTHSLRPKGPVTEIGGASSKSRKKAASWSDEDTNVLLDFLLEELPSAGDGGNFKKVTWTAAASHISTKFKLTKGGEKNSIACECRFRLVSRINWIIWMILSLTNATDEEAISRCPRS